MNSSSLPAPKEASTSFFRAMGGVAKWDEASYFRTDSSLED
jgi:hypothetical protein